jgi:hypothetical protein
MKELEGFGITITVKKAYLIGFQFFQFLMLKNRPESHKISSVWTRSRFGPGHIDKEYYFPVRLNF